MQAGGDVLISLVSAGTRGGVRAADPTLAVLARRAAAGDDAAFDVIYRRLDAGLRRFLARRGIASTAQVEELAQTTWVDVWLALQAGRYDASRSALTTFLYAVAHKTWLQHRRRMRGERASTLEVSALSSVALDESADPGDAMDLAAEVQLVRDCLFDQGTAGLTQDEHTVILGLRAGESERTLAARLGLAASTVHARKLSAFDKLRRYIDLRGTGSSGTERGQSLDG